MCYDLRVYPKSYGILKSPYGVIDLSGVYDQDFDIFHYIVTSQDHTIEFRVQYRIVTGVLYLSKVLDNPFHIVHRINIVKSSVELKLFTKHNLVFKNSFI